MDVHVAQRLTHQASKPSRFISPRDHSGKGPWSSKALKFRLVPAGSIMTPCGIFLKIASPTTPAKKTLLFGECFWCFSLCQVRKCCNIHLAIYIYIHIYITCDYCSIYIYVYIYVYDLYFIRTIPKLQSHQSRLSLPYIFMVLIQGKWPWPWLLYTHNRT